LSGSAHETSWAARLSLLATLCAVPLFLFGGTITTVGAGMAVQGWWDAEGHFMPFFPLAKWLRDFGTFVEHTHRLWGMAVGFFALAAALVALWRVPRPAAKAWAVAALLAVIGQGTLGGFRVLENSPQLAFLHGVAAQAVFAVLAAATLVLGRRYRESVPDGALRPGPGLAAGCALLTALTFGQITLGAWYRHGLRPLPIEGLEPRFHGHVAAAVVLLAAVVLTARALRSAAGGGGAPAAERLRSAARRLHALVGAQILLGLGAWLAYVPAPAGGAKEHGQAEIVLSALHVLGGALLLAQCLAALLWVLRLRGRSAARP
jgi:cytochrome c oxidase assembly protein subunit 15